MKKISHGELLKEAEKWHDNDPYIVGSPGNATDGIAFIVGIGVIAIFAFLYVF